ncbi:unnamed protein product [Pleuronectes platessa]|uniref:Uncharacterized protein n=1 Tax=Pleuronectes platessa TaxID=8262 RepID=A0A9N7Y9J5_PLEPL|nr:unnamed protein product [Pleuronectes platessa]
MEGGGGGGEEENCQVWRDDEERGKRERERENGTETHWECWHPSPLPLSGNVGISHPLPPPSLPGVPHPLTGITGTPLTQERRGGACLRRVAAHRNYSSHKKRWRVLLMDPSDAFLSSETPPPHTSPN